MAIRYYYSITNVITDGDPVTSRPFHPDSNVRDCLALLQRDAAQYARLWEGHGQPCLGQGDGQECCVRCINYLAYHFKVMAA